MFSGGAGQLLPRVLGPWIAAAVVVGTVIGSGVFKKARNVAEAVPEFGLAMAVWVLGGVATLLGALALAEVAVLLPRAGGNYVYLREAYGRGAGFMWGWVEFWIIRSASIAALATMFSESFHDVLRTVLYPQAGSVSATEVLPFWPRQLCTIAVIAALAAVNARGARLGGGVQFLVTAVKVAALLFLIALPWVVVACVTEPSYVPQTANWQPLWPQRWGGVDWSLFGTALIGTLWAYHGWMNIAPVAEEIREPQRNIPLALILGVGVLILLYCSVNASYYLILSRDDMIALTDTTVATEYCLRLLGPVGAWIASLVVMTSVFGSLNGNLLVGPRLLLAMGRDRLAPAALSRLHPRHQTPALATAVLAGWACLLVLVCGLLSRYPLPRIPLGITELDLNVPTGKSPFDIMTDFAIFGAVIFETLAVASIFVLRRRYPPAQRPASYRCWGYPWVPAAYVLLMSGVLLTYFVNPQQRSEAMFGLGFIAVGGGVYWLFLYRQR